MITLTLIWIAGFALVGFVAIAICVKLAPLGYEDPQGFHVASKWPVRRMVIPLRKKLVGATR